MKFIDYWKPLGEPEKNSLAVRCKTSVGYLNLVALGHKKAGYKLAIDLDRETGGAVPCEESRPDVDWSYLRGTKRTNSIQRRAHG